MTATLTKARPHPLASRPQWGLWEKQPCASCPWDWQDLMIAPKFVAQKSYSECKSSQPLGCWVWGIQEGKKPSFLRILNSCWENMSLYSSLIQACVVVSHKPYLLPAISSFCFPFLLSFYSSSSLWRLGAFFYFILIEVEELLFFFFWNLGWW